ncbi:MAG: 1,4-dihydroxy-6-naphthoate synthase [Saprospiraceae bacterium]|nr:1,4-dihydroxy-6-naphthoate synthase [Saprospiraceae bacterium]
MKLSLGFSPCPNDTFIFDAMIHGKIDTEGLDFKVILGDVEELNQSAFRGDLDITKLSFHAFAHLVDTYCLLDAGSALGRNCGPLLIAKAPMNPSEIESGKIAIPGKYTTANFLLSLAYPNVSQKIETLFSDIEGAVLNGQVDAGLIIHENRFTYQEKGLVKLLDLGEYWESTTSMPIPLGGIVVHRKLDPDIQETVNRVLQRSVEYAFANPKSALPYIRQHAQEMEEEVMYAHIDLYVNDFSRDLGREGKEAVQYLFDKATQLGHIPAHTKSVFLHPLAKV